MSLPSSNCLSMVEVARVDDFRTLHVAPDRKGAGPCPVGSLGGLNFDEGGAMEGTGLTCNTGTSPALAVKRFILIWVGCQNQRERSFF